MLQIYKRLTNLWYILYKRVSVPILKFKYRNRPYAEYYAKVMKNMTAKDPKAAVGGMWDEIGQLQFDFLSKQGLKKEHKLLDFGCGSLRAGLHFIKYLDKGNYFGVDISPEILSAAKKHLREEKLEYKKPLLKLSNDLKFNNFDGYKFDYILSQSVLTHMPKHDIEELFSNIHKVMNHSSIYFATFWEEGSKIFTKDFVNFYYPFEFLRDIGEKVGLSIKLIGDYDHPRKQKMMKITLKESNHR